MIDDRDPEVELPAADASGRLSLDLRDAGRGVSMRREEDGEAFDLAEVVDQSTVALAVVSLAGTFLSVNSALATLLGTPTEELVGRAASFLRPDEGTSFLEQTASLRSGFEHEVRVRRSVTRPDSSTISVELRTWAVQDRLGRPSALGCQVTDVSQQVAAGAAAVRSHGRLRTIIAESSDLLTIIDTAGRVSYSSPAEQALLGYVKGQRIGADALDIVHPEDRSLVAGLISRHRAQSGRAEVHCRLAHLDGSWRQFEGEVVGPEDGDGSTGVLLTLRDVTDRHRAEAAHRETEQRYRQLVDGSPHAILIEADGHVIYANAAAATLLGLEHPDEHLGRVLIDWVEPASREAFLERRQRALDHVGASAWTESRLVRTDGAVVDVSSVARAVDFLGRRALYVTLWDITEPKRAQAQLAHQAAHDPLTGLPNRAVLLDRLRRNTAQRERRGGGLAVMVVDLDQFKVVNDEFGHAAGDVILVEAAQRLNRAVRPMDIVARLGGDEFVVVCDGVTSEEEVGAIATRIVSAFSSPFDMGGREVDVGASVGVALSTVTAQGQELVALADGAMYRAKQLGRGRWEMADPTEPQEPTDRREPSPTG
ncbi:hypothetical protein BH24ACT3_BH24ACT3_18980 [soil metagenome]